MASKLQIVTEFSQKKTLELTSVRGNWQRYLKTAARIYKYPFRDQLLIYAQRPDATACATIELWNKRMDRWVNRGSRGIALLDDSGPKTRLKYVFDVSDTHPGRHRPQEPQLWRMEPAYEEAVLESIRNSFEVEQESGDSFAEQICSMSRVIAQDNLADYLEELRSTREGSFLEDLDDLNLSVRLKTLLENSLAYTVLTRCGYDADRYFDETDFEFIHDFSTYETVSVLGNASASISKTVLLDIGRTVQQQERTSKFAKRQNPVYDRAIEGQRRAVRKETERYDRGTDIHPDRGVSVSRPEPAGAGGGHPDGQVRDAAQDVPEGAQADAVRPAAAGGQAGHSPDEHRPAGHRDGGGADEGAGAAERGGRDDEGHQSAGVGTGHEQLQGVGGGSGTPAADLQLIPPAEQVHNAPMEAENVLPTSSAFFVGQQAVDQFLRYGGNTDELRMRVIHLFQMDIPQPLMTTRLQALYHGGNGITTEQGPMAAWYDEDGIHLAHGNRARYEANAQVIPWERAAQRIGALLEAGQFASNVELLEADGYERSLLAESLIYLYRDLNREDHPNDFLPCLTDEAKWLDFTKDQPRLTDFLADPDFRKTLLTEYRAFLAAYQEDRSVMRFHYHDFHGLLSRLEELDLPRKTFSTTLTELPAIMPFITEDEIDEALAGGSHFEGGPKRIYSFFQQPHDTREKADFLRKEYGTGSHSHALSRSGYSHEDYDSKGIRFTKGNCPEINLSWAKVAQRIENLVRKDRYLSPKAMAEYEAELASQEVPEGREPAAMQYNAIKERYPNHVVLFQVGDFYELYGEDAKALAPELGLTLTTRPVPGVSRVEMCGLPAHRLEHYTDRLRRSHDVLVSSLPEGKRERRETAMERFSGPRRYQIPLGSAVYIGTKRYEMQSLGEATVTLYDPEFPLFTQELPRADFDRKLEENPLNEKYFLPYVEPAIAQSGPEPDQAAKENAALDEAKALITDFWATEFDGFQPTDFENLRKVGLAHTTLTDDEIPVQINVNLIDYSIERYVMDVLVERRQYESLTALIEQELSDLDFDDLISFSEEQLQRGISQEAQFTTEQVATYPAEQTKLPYDISVEVLKSNARQKEALPERYEVVVYHHFENGFDERADYTTLEEAERVAQGYVDGTMEDDGFRYDGAAVYDLKEERYLRIIGAYPDPAAHAQVMENALERPAPEQGQAEGLPDLEAEVKAWEAEQAAKKQAVIDTLSDREKIIIQAMETAGFLFALSEGRAEITFSAGEFGYPSVFQTWDEAYTWINEAQLKDTPGLREQVQAILHPALDEKGRLSQAAPAAQRELTNEEYAQANLIPGETEFEQDGRRYRVHSVDLATNQVELTDLTFAQSAGFPILRMEYIGTIRAYLEHPAPLEPPREPPKSRAAARSNVLYPEQTDRHDYRITDDALGVGAPSQRYQNNIAAIRLLKQLESEERLATPEEQEILSRYVGWGGLADCFEETNRNYLELKNLLTPEEYEAARESTLTSFYTPPVVIRSMYQALEQMGFETGNVLEPSCGTGNFLGMMPKRMSSSRRYAIELDEISGRIAQQLYQTASVTIQGYEKTDLPDSFFDVAIGNIPFGNFKVVDRRYDKHNFLIHDYFFGKTLDKVRPGGIVAFITSKGTMDKENPAVRKYIAQRADLLGAIRLPNNTFKGAAGTEVTSDILFLQKRDSILDLEPDWVHLGISETGLKMNQYFIDHPEMILGEMQEVSGPYGPETACIPFEGLELSDLLTSAIGNIGGSIQEYEREEGDELEEDRSIPADPTVRNFSYTIVDGEVYYRENSRMNPVEVSTTTLGRIKGLIGLRDCVRQLIEYQTEDYPDYLISAEQQRLNSQYDVFVKKYGRISQRANNSAFHSDNSYFLLASLEVTDSDGNFIRKADMFTKRTIKQKVNVSRVDTASEALALSLAEKARIDIPYMTDLTGKDEATLVDELQGVMFQLPGRADSEGHPVYVTADEYLSGNVRQKLRQAELAAQADNRFRINAETLKAVQPADLTASEISVRLGATWLPPEDVAQFMFELFDTPHYMRFKIKIHYSKLTGNWNIEGKSYDRSSIRANSTYGTSRMSGYKIIEETLNLKDVRIFDYVEDEDGRKTAVLNKKETAIAQSKQQLIKQAFADWIWKDPKRRERLCKLYNETFNSVRPREYDGSHLNFVGINPEITLRRHQVNAIAHILYGGNTLLAHVVGAGKTFEIVAAAQESKRLGLCSKSLIAVPNHLTEQWAAEYLQLYPSANILVATKKDFEPKNRKKFCGRIATGDYDAIIIGHSQLEKIPMSLERQRAILEEQLQEVIDGISDLKQSHGDNFSIKQMERTKKGLKVKLDKLNDQSRKDDVVTFEELGVDRLFIDEAHNYKNLAVYTKMRNVGGISQTEAQKSSDLYMKCRYLDELTGGRGVVFATGTPISNTMVELYTMQKYLQHDTLQGNDLLHFDSWASTFGETVTAIELAPEGTGYRAKTRFAKFYNLPELMSMFKEVADIQTADMLNLPVPKANYHHVVLKPSEHQKEMVADLGERAERVRNKMVDISQDNMLMITNDGRKLALDQRLLNPLLPDSDTGKVSACADNIFEIWQRTAPQKSTQLAFCDLSTPKKDGSFNVYDDLRDKLIAKGIPAEQIAYIHNANTEQQKKELFGKVCSGEVRVLLGSTAKMGAGTNVQKKLIALHHLDCPWRPADLQQREGRIIRQGNENQEVEIYTYVTENTFDSYLYQLVESKQKFIGQIMTSKSPVRSAEDIDETALNYAEIKALCSGNPHIKEKTDLEVDVGRLKLLKANHLSQKYDLEDQILKDFPKRIASLEQQIAGYKKDIAHLAEGTKPNSDGFSPMVVHETEYAEKKDAGTAVLEACKAMTSPEAVVIGSYRGFTMELSFDTFRREYQLTLCHGLHHTVTLGTDIYGNLQRIDNALEGLESRLKAVEQTLDDTKAQLDTAKLEVQKPFAQEEELAAKSARLEELNALLKIDQRDNELAEPSAEEVEEENERNTPRRSRWAER